MGGRSLQQVWHSRATRSRSTYRPSNSLERRKDFKGTKDLETIIETTFPDCQRRLPPFHELIKSDKPAKIDQELITKFEAINKSLDHACGLWLKQPLPNPQYVLVTDANFKNAGYALMTEEDSEQKIPFTDKTYAPVAFGSKTFSTSQLKLSI